MGKKSLTQSTDKKKTSGTGKKSTDTSKKTAAAKKKGTQKKSAAASAKTKTTKKTTAKKTSAAKKTTKKPSLKTLRKKKFDTWRPENPFVPEKGPDPEKNYTAPAITDDYEGETGKKIRELLLKPIDLSMPEPESAPAQPEADTDDLQKDKEAAISVKTEESTAVQAESPEEAASETEAGPAPAGTPAEPAEKAPKPEGSSEEPPAEPAASPEPETKEPAPETEAADKNNAAPKPAAEKEQNKPTDRGKPPEPPGPPGPPGPSGPGNGGKRELPISRAMMGLTGAVALILALLVGASFQNMGNYYLKRTSTALEIWQGNFSPAGKTRIAVLRGAKAPAEIRNSYSKKPALSLAFDYYMEKADALSEATDLPDFRAIRNYLEKAGQFAVTQEQRSRVKQRLHRIEYLKLLYQAEVAAEKQTQSSLETALNYLEQASALEIDADAQQVVKQRINRTREALEKQEQEAVSAEKTEAAEAEATGSGRTTGDEKAGEKAESQKPEEPDQAENQE